MPAAPVTPLSANPAPTPPANQATAFNTPDLVTRAGKILFAALVLALVLESALAVIFNWRVFLEFFDGRGVRTLLMIVAAWLVVYGFDKDFIYELLSVFSSSGVDNPMDSHAGTLLLSTLVLAGGSASVNRLMVSLGIRDNRTVEQVTPKPPSNRAWVSFTALCLPGPGSTALRHVPFRVLSTTGMTPTTAAIIGGTDERNDRARLRQYFWRDVHRVPRSGGYELVPGQSYGFVIEAIVDGRRDYRNLAGERLTLNTADGSFSPQPEAVQLAPGAIVDFVVRFAALPPPETLAK